jgi:D-glycero-alpha-D-manno-heptose-7-phosphate kinase
MFISRTPCRISLGGGSTDLPSYCREHGGFIFGCAINMYMDIFVRRPVIYDRIDVQYKDFESVDSVDEVKHPIAREALKMTGVDRCVSIYFKSDTPMGTGLGSSGSCAVGLLNILHNFKGASKTKAELAEEAFQLTQRLGLPDGRQDPYLAALGGFTVLELSVDGGVQWRHPNIHQETIDQFLRNSLFFYTGVCRDSVDVLRDQDHAKAIELKHRTKVIGRQILAAFENGNLDDFGRLMHEHWLLKREMSDKITSPEFDRIYHLAIANGALGGKLIGAGGGGYFLFYCPDQDAKARTLAALRDFNFKFIDIGVDYQGTRALNLTL